jgi:hypothetical protein
MTARRFFALARRSARRLALLLAFGAMAQAPAQNLTQGRFEVLDVYVESAQPLAAYQFELTERAGQMQVVGIEGGEARAFAEAPYYDREAVARGAADKIIVASFSLDAPAFLPVGRTRVASVHVRLTGTEEPDYDLSLVAAGTADGASVPAKIALAPRAGR